MPLRDHPPFSWFVRPPHCLLFSLPSEVLVQILSLVDLRDLLRLQHLSPRICRLIAANRTSLARTISGSIDAVLPGSDVEGFFWPREALIRLRIFSSGNGSFFSGQECELLYKGVEYKNDEFRFSSKVDFRRFLGYLLSVLDPKTLLLSMTREEILRISHLIPVSTKTLYWGAIKADDNEVPFLVALSRLPQFETLEVCPAFPVFKPFHTISSKFYFHPNILALLNFWINNRNCNGCNKTPLNDEAFLAQRWNTAYIGLTTDVTAEGINALLLQWQRGERDFEKMELEIACTQGNLQKMLQNLTTKAVTQNEATIVRHDTRKMKISIRVVQLAKHVLPYVHVELVVQALE